MKIASLAPCDKWGSLRQEFQARCADPVPSRALSVACGAGMVAEVGGTGSSLARTGSEVRSVVERAHTAEVNGRISVEVEQLFESHRLNKYLWISPWVCCCYFLYQFYLP